MSSSISRRSLAKGAAWAAPVVLASATIPAYAASKNDRAYGAQVSYMGYYDYSGTNSYNCTNYFEVTNEEEFIYNGRRTLPAGITIMYPEGMGKTQPVTINSVETVWYIPSGWIEEFEVTSGDFYFDGAYSPNSDYVKLQDGTRFSTEGYTAYVFKANGIGTVTQPEGSFNNDPATFFSAVPTGYYTCETSLRIKCYVYNGIDFTTADGFHDKIEFANHAPLFNERR